MPEAPIIECIVSTVKGIQKYMHAITEADLPYISSDFLQSQLSLTSSMRADYECRQNRVIAAQTSEERKTAEIASRETFLVQCYALLDCIEEVMEHLPSPCDRRPETPTTPEELRRILLEFARQRQLILQQSIYVLQQQFIASHSRNASSSFKSLLNYAVCPVKAPEEMLGIKASTPLALQRQYTPSSELPATPCAFPVTDRDQPVVQSTVDIIDSESGDLGGKKDVPSIANDRLPTQCCSNATHSSASRPTFTKEAMPTHLSRITVHTSQNTVHYPPFAQPTGSDGCQELSAASTCRCCTESPQPQDGCTQHFLELPHEGFQVIEEQDTPSRDLANQYTPPERGKLQDPCDACLNDDVLGDVPANQPALLSSPASSNNAVQYGPVSDILSRGLPPCFADPATSACRTQIPAAKELLATHPADRPSFNREMPPAYQKLGLPSLSSDDPVTSDVIACKPVTAQVTPCLGLRRIGLSSDCDYRLLPDTSWNTQPYLRMRLS